MGNVKKKTNVFKEVILPKDKNIIAEVCNLYDIELILLSYPNVNQNHIKTLDNIIDIKLTTI